MSNFEIIVIGGGPGGYVSALKAAQLGAKVALVEKHHLGGTCLNYGCIPSKALLSSAELMHACHTADAMGVEIAGPVTANWEKIQARKDKILAGQRAGIKGLLTGRKVTIVSGKAVLQGPGKVVVHDGNGGAQELTAPRIILATGSVPSRIPGLPADPERICTSDEALHWRTLPKKLLVVGGGVIGCELACAMQAFGVEVAIVEMLPRLLPFMEAEIAAALRKVFEGRGIKCFTSKKISEVKLAGEGVSVRLESGETFEADRLLLSTGRRPSTSDIGVESAGLALDRGFIQVNDRMETPVNGYYCIGDANGRCLLAHAASAQGVTAAENALGHKATAAEIVPNCVYTFPEAASAGMTTEEAVTKRIPVFVGAFPLKFLGRAQASGQVEGFVRVLRHREDGRLLGVHIFGHNATEIIMAASALLHQKVTVEELTDVVFAHPTMGEAIKEAAEDALHLGLHMMPRRAKRVAAEVAA